MSDETLSYYAPSREILSNSMAMGLSRAGEQGRTWLTRVAWSLYPGRS